MRNYLKILQAEAVGAIAFVAPVIDPSIPRLSHKKLGSLSLHLVKPHFTSSSWKWGTHGIHKVSHIISTLGVPSSSKKLQVLDLFLCYWSWSSAPEIWVSLAAWERIHIPKFPPSTERLERRDWPTEALSWPASGAATSMVLVPNSSWNHQKCSKRVTVNWKNMENYETVMPCFKSLCNCRFCLQSCCWISIHIYIYIIYILYTYTIYIYYIPISYTHIPVCTVYIIISI